MAIPGGRSRKFSRFTAGFLAALLVVLSPGLEAYQAFAASTPNRPGKSGRPTPTPFKASVPPGGGLSISRVPAFSIPASPAASFARFGAAPEALPLPGVLGDQPPLQQLVYTAADSERPFARRVQAVLELRNQGGEQALAALSRLGRAEQPVPAPAAFDGTELGRLEERAADPELPFAERVAAARGLLRSTSPKAREALARLGGGLEDYELKRQALRALAHHGRLQSLPPVTPRQAAELLENRPDAVVFGPGAWKGDERSAEALKSLSASGVETVVAGGWRQVERLPAETRKGISAVARGQLLVFDAAGREQEVASSLGGSRVDAAVLLARDYRETLVRLRDSFARVSTRWLGWARRVLGRLPSPRLAARETWAVSSEGRAAQGAGTTISVSGFADPREDGVLLWPSKGTGAGAEVAEVVARPEPSPVDKKAMRGLFTVRTLSIIAFVATSLAYPFVAKSVLGGGAGGEALYGTVVALGQLGSIVAGPMAAWLSRRYSPRKVMRVNAILRVVLALELPIFWLLGLLAPGTPHLVVFAILLFGSFANYFVLSSIMTTEGTYLRRFVGSKNLGTANSLLQINYFAIQVLLGLIAGVGTWIDGLRGLGMKYSMIPFALAALIQLAALPILKRTIPDDSPQEAARPRARENRLRALRRIGLFLHRHRREAALLAAAVVSFFFLHSALPIGAALLLWVLRTKSGRGLLANKPLRNAVILLALGAALVVPLQYFVLQSMAGALPGGSSLVLGKLWGALFLGQMIASSSLARLARLKIPLLGRFGAQRLVQLGVLAITAAWVYTGLFPGSLLAAAAAAGLGAVLMALAGRLTDRGWVQWAGVGFAAVALPLLFWGNFPVLFASMVILGFFYGPALITLMSYFQRRVHEQHAGGLIGVQSSVLNTTISLGFGLMALISGFYQPLLFPQMLLPLLGLFLGVGVLYFAAVKRGLLPGFSPTSLKPKE